MGLRGVELLAAECAVVVVGCLRNASAVAAAVSEIDGPIGLVPAGNGGRTPTMRVAVEDTLGAGAIAAALDDRSPEADAATDLFVATRDRGLRDVHGRLASGRELIADGVRSRHRPGGRAGRQRAVPWMCDGFLAA